MATAMGETPEETQALSREREVDQFPERSGGLEPELRTDQPLLSRSSFAGVVGHRRLPRVLLRGGVALRTSANSLGVVLGLFLAGASLMFASGIQLLLVLPGLSLRRACVKFAAWSLQMSRSLRRRARFNLTHP